MLNVEQNDIRELNMAEIEAVSGAYSWGEFKQDAVSFFNSVVTGFTETKAGLEQAKA
jgi:hypothetical protein